MSSAKTYSIVEVTFHDGEVKSYSISASPAIGGYLTRESATTGVLNLFNEDESWGIPVANIRDWSIRRGVVEPGSTLADADGAITDQPTVEETEK